MPHLTLLSDGEVTERSVKGVVTESQLWPICSSQSNKTLSADHASITKLLTDTVSLIKMTSLQTHSHNNDPLNVQNPDWWEL